MKKQLFLLSIIVLSLSLFVDAAVPSSPLLITKSATAPVLDGEYTDASWSAVPWQAIDIIFAGESSGFGDKGATPADDLSARFKMAFDNTKIYFLVDVQDENITQDPGAHWVGDKVEIYFGLPGYDETAGGNAPHARQFAIRAQMDPTEKGAEGSANYPPASDALITNGVSYTFSETASGYVLEGSIDRAIALEDLPDNSTIGFDICVADNDEPTSPGSRYRKSWFNDGAFKELWVSMSGAGKLTLNATTGLPADTKKIGYSLTNNRLMVNTDTNVDINIYNLTGKLILSATNSQNINVASLNKGIFIANIKTANGILLGNFRFVK